MNAHITDIAIIGAGPVGLFAIFQAGMMGLKAHVIDPLNQAGGQCHALYASKPIYDIPGHAKVTGQNLINQLLEQADRFKPLYHFNQQVMGLKKQEEQKFLLTTNKGTQIQARSVFIAAGAGCFAPKRPPIENLDLYEKTQCVQYHVKDSQTFKNKNLVIAGGGDSAMDWVMNLAPLAHHIYFIHRRKTFRASAQHQEQLKSWQEKGKVSLLTPYQLKGLSGENGHLKTVHIQDLDGNTQCLDTDYLLAFFGLASELGPIKEWGLHLNHATICTTLPNMETNIKGIFAMGDVADYTGKLKLILTGFSEAAHAAHGARAYLYPGKNFHFQHSTSSPLLNH